VQLSAPVPVFNRNQGNITVAHAGLVRARQNLNDTNNTLMSQLAETYNRYATSRVISESYRTDLLPDQVRVYRGVYDRFLIDGESIDFAQVVVAQQTLAQVVTSYLQSLTDAWMATVDLAELLQVDDLMTMDGMAVSSTTAPGSNELAVPAIPETALPQTAGDDAQEPSQPISNRLPAATEDSLTSDAFPSLTNTDVSTVSSQKLGRVTDPGEESGTAFPSPQRSRRSRPSPRMIEQ
jgi:cobalt-zinc-cadmium efflux system outer membrane protein